MGDISDFTWKHLKESEVSVDFQVTLGKMLAGETTHSSVIPMTRDVAQCGLSQHGKRRWAGKHTKMV